jgi:hypothetical protein
VSHLVPFALLGVLLAAVQSAALAYNVRLYLGPASVERAVAVHFLRLGLVVACFVLVAFAGARPLLATVGGFFATEVWMGARRRPRPA